MGECGYALRGQSVHEDCKGNIGYGVWRYKCYRPDSRREVADGGAWYSRPSLEDATGTRNPSNEIG